MKLFEKFSTKEISKLRNDTSNFFIGSPEAEAESTLNSKVQLDDVFEDFLNVITKLQNEKFIISGRKGSGKSAIAERIYSYSRDNAEYFCDFIKKGDIDIEKIISHEFKFEDIQKAFDLVADYGDGVLKCIITNN
jgi:hypothetical protein